MPTLGEDITKVLSQTRDEIRANMASKGINASGRTSAAIVVEQGSGSIRLVKKAGRNAPLSTLEIGRPGGNVPGGFRTTKAGKRDVSNAFKYILIEWAKAKGIADFGWGAATMLGRRIAAEGTLRNKNHVDVYSTPVKNATERLKSDIRSWFVTQLRETIKTNF